MRTSFLVVPCAALLLSCGDAGSWDGTVQCTFYDGTENVVFIDTLVCVEGGGYDCGTEPWSQAYDGWTATVSLVDSDFEGQSISISVQPTDLDGDVADGGVTVLYQLDGTPRNEFVGGHGFTGLHYVRHPQQDNTFQFFCHAAD